MKIKYESFSFGCMDELACNFDADANFDPATTTGEHRVLIRTKLHCDGNVLKM